jgi:manganese transport protein
MKKDIFKYIGPGLIVAVAFIDPGNWASNVAAGSAYGYKLLWVITLSTIIMIILQHNSAHLGIATGDCLSESASKNIKPVFSKAILSTAVLAAVAIAVAEILGGGYSFEYAVQIAHKSWWNSAFYTVNFYVVYRHIQKN